MGRYADTRYYTYRALLVVTVRLLASSTPAIWLPSFLEKRLFQSRLCNTNLLAVFKVGVIFKFVIDSACKLDAGHMVAQLPGEEVISKSSLQY
jgi:hypothetical protein